MRFALSLLLFCFFAVLGFAAPTSAAMVQDKDAVSDIATVYLDEMEDFYNQCGTNPALHENYDCRCLSVQYLDKIRALGQYDRDEVVKSLDKSACPRTEETAARERNKNIPQAYLDEAEAFYNACGSDPIYGSHYNCECLSSRYLDERIKLGRFVDPSLIKLNIANSCANAPAAAGYAYKNCIKRGFNVPAKFEIEPYCSCIANEYAKMYVSAGQSFSPKLLIALQTEAAIRCNKKL